MSALRMMETTRRMSLRLHILRRDDFDLAVDQAFRAGGAPGHHVRRVKMLAERFPRGPALNEHDLVGIGHTLVQIIKETAVFLAGTGDDKLRSIEQLRQFPWLHAQRGNNENHWTF